jgi:ribosomal protein S18 acetylase RimI-like enzyme
MCSAGTENAVIRAIEPGERARFAHLDDPEQQRILAQHLDDAFASGATSEAFCLVAERGGRWIGRALLRGPAGLDQIFVHFFDVDLGEQDADDVARGLISAVLAAPADDDERTLLYALDVEHPWHPEPVRRRAWFEAAGFEVAREAQRWEWPPSAELAPASGRLAFRTLKEVGEDAFREAIARVSDDTLDKRLREMRARLGRDGDAAEHFRLLTGLRHEPDWLELGFDGGELVGLIACGGGVDVAFVVYVGVVPEMRGRGFVNELLAHATRVLFEAGEETIRADTDVANEPMAKAFERAGYLQFMTRTELVMTPERRRASLRSADVRTTSATVVPRC